MLSVKGIYENGKIKFLERIPRKGRFEVVITFLDKQRKASIEKDRLVGLLSSLSETDFQEFLAFCQSREQDWFKGRKIEI